VVHAEQKKIPTRTSSRPRSGQNFERSASHLLFLQKIRDDEGYWTQLEAYIQEHSDWPR
jgi:hypothetical protein